MRRLSLVVGLVFLLSPLESWAHEHRAAFGFMPRYVNRSDLKAFGVAFEKVFCENDDCVLEKGPGGNSYPLCVKPKKLSLLTEASYAWGEHEEKNLSQFTAMVGVRISDHGRRPADSGKGPKFLRPFAHLLAGFVHENEAGVFRESVTGAAGLGADLGTGDWALRLQGDLVYSEPTGLYPQLSVGVVLRFH